MITTNDDVLADQCRLLRHHGEPEWYVYNRLGYNYRMTEIQGAIGRVQLKRINNFIKNRNKNAQYLSKATSDITGIKPPLYLIIANLHLIFGLVALILIY